MKTDLNIGHSVVKRTAALMTAARSLFVAGLVVIIFVIASRKIQETLFGWEIGDIPVSAYAALAIGIICVFASIICFVTGIALKKSRLYLEEISMPADPADDFAQRLSKAGLVWLLVPMIFCIGIQAPNIIHNINTHNTNVPKRWAVVNELDAVFPGLRSTYSDREINAPDYDTIGLYFDCARDGEAEFDPYAFSVKMDYTGHIIEIEYELYSADGKKVPTLDDLNAFVSRVGEGLKQCGSVDSAFLTPVPDRAVTRARAEALKNGLESGYGQGWTIENGVACAYTCANNYTRYEVSTDENAIEIAEFDDKRAAKAENE